MNLESLLRQKIAILSPLWNLETISLKLSESSIEYLWKPDCISVIISPSRILVAELEELSILETITPSSTPSKSSG